MLEPNAALADPFPVESAGLFGASFEDDLSRFVILAVTPSTPVADAGALAGDEVIAVDGVPFSTFGMPKLFARVHGPVR